MRNILNMNTSQVPVFVYAILQKHENHVKKQKLKQFIKKKEKNMQYTESPILRNRMKKDIKCVQQKINEIDNQINMYK